MYKKQIEQYEELKSKWKTKESNIKKQHSKEIKEVINLYYNNLKVFFM